MHTAFPNLNSETTMFWDFLMVNLGYMHPIIGNSSLCSPIDQETKATMTELNKVQSSAGWLLHLFYIPAEHYSEARSPQLRPCATIIT